MPQLKQKSLTDSTYQEIGKSLKCKSVIKYKQCVSMEHCFIYHSQVILDKLLVVVIT